jgi:hypothetical protein
LKASLHASLLSQQSPDTAATVAYLWRNWRGRLTDRQDWFWRAALPWASGLALAGSGVWLIVGSSDALPWLAGVTSVLLATAIRNAWGLATWIVEHRNDHTAPKVDAAT